MSKRLREQKSLRTITLNKISSSFYDHKGKKCIKYTISVQKYFNTY